MSDLATELRAVKSSLEKSKQDYFRKLREERAREQRKADLPITRPRDLGTTQAIAGIESQAKQIVKAAEQVKEETIITEITTVKTGEELFAEAKAAGTIPANATYTSYNQDTGELSYSVPTPPPTGEEAFRLGKEQGVIPQDAYYLGYDTVTGQVSYTIPLTTSEILNTLYKFGIKGDVKVEHYDVTTGEVLYTAQPFYWKAVMTSGKEYLIAANTIEEARQAANALGSVAYVHLTFSTTPEQRAAAIGATPGTSGTANLGTVLNAYKTEGGYDVAKMFADGYTIEQLTEMGFDAAALELVQTELAVFEEANVRLDTGEYIARAEFEQLTEAQKSYLNEHGVEAYNESQEAQELFVEVETAKGKKTMSLKEWETMSEIKRFEFILGRAPTLSEWRDYRLQEAGVDLSWWQEIIPGTAQVAGFIAEAIPGEQEIERWLEIQISAQEEWQREYPGQMWTAPFITSAEQLGFPAAKALYPQIAITDISGAEWAVTGGSIALWTMSAWLPKAVAGIKKVAGIKLTTKTPIINLQKPVTVTDLGLFGKRVTIQSPVRITWGAGLQRAGLSAQVETLAFNAGTAARELTVATKVASKETGAVLSTEIASTLRQAQVRSLAADTKFLEALNGLKLNIKQIALLEQATGYTGLETPIRNVATAIQNLRKAWDITVGAEQMYGMGSQNYLLTLENVAKARAELGKAVDELDNVLKPRFTEAPPAPGFIGYETKWGTQYVVEPSPPSVIETGGYGSKRGGVALAEANLANLSLKSVHTLSLLPRWAESVAKPSGLVGYPVFSAERAFSGLWTVPVSLQAETEMPAIVQATPAEAITELAITEEQLAGTVPLTEGQAQVIAQVSGSTVEQIQLAAQSGTLVTVLTDTTVLTNLNTISKEELSQRLQTQTKTQLAMIPQAAQAVKTVIDTRIKPKLLPGYIPLRGEGEDTPNKVYPNGTAVWKMGMWWKIIPPNWSLDKPISSRYPPAGVTKVHGTPQETLTFVGGEIPFKNIAFDLGVVDGFIDVKQQKIYFSGNGESTDVGLNIPGPTKGITLSDQETEETPMMKPKELAEKLRLRPTPRPSRSNAYRDLMRKATRGERISREELREAWH